MPSPQLRIASRLLGHLLWQAPTRELPERMEDVQHAWDVAGALLQLSREIEPSVDDETSGPTAPALRPSLAPRRSIAVRRSVVDRSALHVLQSSAEQWRASRTMKKPTPTEADQRMGPTFH